MTQDLEIHRVVLLRECRYYDCCMDGCQHDNWTIVETILVTFKSEKAHDYVKLNEKTQDEYHMIEVQSAEIRTTEWK